MESKRKFKIISQGGELRRFSKGKHWNFEKDPERTLRDNNWKDLERNLR
jgi:hypothetical protein